MGCGRVENHMGARKRNRNFCFPKFVYRGIFHLSSRCAAPGEESETPFRISVCGPETGESPAALETNGTERNGILRTELEVEETRKTTFIAWAINFGWESVPQRAVPLCAEIIPVASSSNSRRPRAKITGK